MRELAVIEHVAEEQMRDVEREEAENRQTQTTRECGMSVWRVVYAEITALNFHTHIHTHSGHSTTNCVCGSHLILCVHGHICPLPVPPHQHPR